MLPYMGRYLLSRLQEYEDERRAELSRSLSLRVLNQIIRVPLGSPRRVAGLHPALRGRLEPVLRVAAGRGRANSLPAVMMVGTRSSLLSEYRFLPTKFRGKGWLAFAQCKRQYLRFLRFCVSLLSVRVTSINCVAVRITSQSRAYMIVAIMQPLLSPFSSCISRNSSQSQKSLLLSLFSRTTCTGFLSVSSYFAHPAEIRNAKSVDLTPQRQQRAKRPTFQCVDAAIFP